jgi:triacylglycerol lipase
MKLGHEVLAYLRQGALALRPTAGVHGDGEDTVLFVHGHGAGPATFDALRGALASDGHRRFAAFRYGMIGRVRGVAAELERFAARHAPRGALHVVAHSLGGIVARTWLQEVASPALRERVRTLVTLSTAHSGLRDLPGARLLPLVRELVSGHELLASLARSAHLLEAVRRVSVVSAWDHFVPAERAAFAGAEVVTVDDAGHVGVLFDPGVHARVAEVLRAGGRDRVAAAPADAAAPRGRALLRR